MYKIIGLTKKRIYTYYPKTKEDALALYQQKAKMVADKELLSVMLLYIPPRPKEVILLNHCHR